MYMGIKAGRITGRDLSLVFMQFFTRTDQIFDEECFFIFIQIKCSSSSPNCRPALSKRARYQFSYPLIRFLFKALPCAVKRKHRKFYNFFLFSFFEDFFLLRLLQKKSFLAGVVFEIFALELFCLFFCKNVLQKGNV